MSHSKYTKRGKSLYIEKWNPSAKRFINTCVICGAQGYNPSIDDIRGAAGLDICGVDADTTLIQILHLGTHADNDVQQHRDIADCGHVVDDTSIPTKQGCSYDGKGSVFHAVNVNVAVEGESAVDDDFFHSNLQNSVD